jgi:hypothetical protein
MKETSKNCVSDYPLSNTECEREAWSVAFFAIGTSGVLLRMCVPQVEVQVKSKAGKSLVR